MATNDPISDMFTRIRNALMAKKEETTVFFSKTATEIAKILFQEGFIDGYEISSDGLKKQHLKIELKYRSSGEPVIQSISRKSRPGKRVYCAKKDIPRVLGGFGIFRRPKSCE